MHHPGECWCYYGNRPGAVMVGISVDWYAAHMFYKAVRALNSWRDLDAAENRLMRKHPVWPWLFFIDHHQLVAGVLQLVLAMTPYQRPQLLIGYNSDPASNCQFFFFPHRGLLYDNLMPRGRRQVVSYVVCSFLNVHWYVFESLHHRTSSVMFIILAVWEYAGHRALVQEWELVSHIWPLSNPAIIRKSSPR